MLFNTHVFLLFAAIVLPLYFLQRHRGQNVLLLIASYVFYGAWDPRFLLLILASTAIDYLCGRGMGRWSGDDAKSRQRRKCLLILSCLSNLGMLGVFKYFDFFIEGAQGLLSTVGLDMPAHRLGIVLPVGISFYTFQTMSYTIDVWAGRMKPTRKLLDFAVFVAFFPQLVAGPIERASSLLPQVEKRRRITRDKLYSGGWLILLGFFKKMVIADNLAVFVDDAFANTSPDNGLTALLATYAFAYQIYCDFSGYSDIARGLSKLMGIELMVNFNLPYLSRSPSEFWRRWHISLSSWLRDYLYIPLGGNRGSKVKTYRNLFLTMLLGGLWHGAAWKFVLWGAYHGGLLSIQKAIDPYLPAIHRPIPRRLISGMKIVGMFHLTAMGWLIFRAESMSQIGKFIYAIASDLVLTPQAITLAVMLGFFVSMLWLIDGYIRNLDDPRERWGWRWGVGPTVVSGMILAILYLSAPAGGSFIYFQF